MRFTNGRYVHAACRGVSLKGLEKTMAHARYSENNAQCCYDYSCRVIHFCSSSSWMLLF